MRAEDVPDAWAHMLDDVFAREGAGQRGIRIALAAVAPLIAAAERERITEILRAHEAGYAKSRASYQAAHNEEMTAFVGGKETALGVALHAIRALGDADG